MFKICSLLKTSESFSADAPAKRRLGVCGRQKLAFESMMRSLEPPFHVKLIASLAPRAGDKLK